MRLSGDALIDLEQLKDTTSENQIALSHINDRRADGGFLGAEGRSRWNVDPLLKEFRHNPMLWLLALVPR